MDTQIKEITEGIAPRGRTYYLNEWLESLSWFILPPTRKKLTVCHSRGGSLVHKLCFMVVSAGLTRDEEQYFSQRNLQTTSVRRSPHIQKQLLQSYLKPHCDLPWRAAIWNIGHHSLYFPSSASLQGCNLHFQRLTLWISSKPHIQGDKGKQR